MTRYMELKDFGMQSIDFSRIPPVRLKMVARHAGVIAAPKIAEMPEQKRISILVAFVKTFEIVALDDALEVLDRCIAEFLPPYSPDFNPIEHTWAQLKSIRNKMKCSIDELFSCSIIGHLFIAR